MSFEYVSDPFLGHAPDTTFEQDDATIVALGNGQAVVFIESSTATATTMQLQLIDETGLIGSPVIVDPRAFESLQGQVTVVDGQFIVATWEANTATSAGPVIWGRVYTVNGDTLSPASDIFDLSGASSTEVPALQGIEALDGGFILEYTRLEGVGTPDAAVVGHVATYELGPGGTSISAGVEASANDDALSGQAVELANGNIAIVSSGNELSEGVVLEVFNPTTAQVVLSPTAVFAYPGTGAFRVTDAIVLADGTLVATGFASGSDGPGFLAFFNDDGTPIRLETALLATAPETAQTQAALAPLADAFADPDTAIISGDFQLEAFDDGHFVLSFRLEVVEEGGTSSSFIILARYSPEGELAGDILIAPDVVNVDTEANQFDMSTDAEGQLFVSWESELVDDDDTFVAAFEAETFNDQVINGTAVGEDLKGSFGDDQITANGGNDTVDGEFGDDTILGGFGFDSLMGGGGNDSIEGNGNADTLVGGDGNDTLVDDAGTDSLVGGDGNDRLISGSGADRIEGGEGDDFIRAGSNFGSSVDGVNGGAGNDTIFGDAGFDLLLGGDGEDSIDGGGQADNIFGDAGNDTLLGGGGFDRLFGGVGDDLIEGQQGTDALFGSFGDDTLNGGTERDRFFGGADDDILNGEEGDDELLGNGGFDTLNGGEGDDRLLGNFNADVFVFEDGHGNDTIADFDEFNQFEKIDLSAVTTVNSLADLNLASDTEGAATQSVADVLITTSTGNTILVQNVLLADLDSNDFIF
ncbi:MAG: hypothetical protein MK180_04560 [Rhodobacteraceae bacterium]|nr:hypothetical protein [Paracoccaceae bacterium]